MKIGREINFKSWTFPDNLFFYKWQPSFHSAMFVYCLYLAFCKTCPTMQVAMRLSHDPSNHFSLSLKAGTVNAHNTWFLYLYFYFCFCICSFVFSEKPEEEREAVATWQRLWWSITLASLHRSNHRIYSFVRTVVGGDGDVDHVDDVDGGDDQWVPRLGFLSHNARQAEH